MERILVHYRVRRVVETGDLEQANLALHIARAGDTVRVQGELAHIVRRTVLHVERFETGSLINTREERDPLTIKLVLNVEGHLNVICVHQFLDRTYHSNLVALKSNNL